MMMKKIAFAALVAVFAAATVQAAVDDATLRSIANGHAFQKHVVTNKEYPEITSKDQFFSLVKGVASAPTASKNLVRGRTAFWGESAKTIVVVDPSSADKGTAFRPSGGRAYFDAQTDIEDVVN